MASFKHDKEDLYQTVFLELKTLGVKVPKIKKFRTNISKQKSVLNEKGKIFGVSLSEQEWVPHGENSLPKFILMATSYLLKFTDKEGLFRKAGNVSRQRKLRAKLEKGDTLQDSDPNDVACLLKQWLRELPEPLIPHSFQNLFVRCQNLDSEENCVSACLLTCLLLPSDHLYSLKHLLNFLSEVALNSKKSRMSTYNLALVIAPNIFATNESIEKVSSYTNNLVYKHTAVMKILIENFDKVGKVPPSIFQQNSLPRPSSTASLDMLFFSANKSRRKLKEDIISGFRKLVGQKSTAAAEAKDPRGEENLLENSFHRQALSVDDLDAASLAETPNFKEEFQTPDNSNSRHVRRKSFGTLLLRRKDKKRSDDNREKPKLSIFVDKIMKDQKESKEKLKVYKSQDPMDIKSDFSNILNRTVSTTTGISNFSSNFPNKKQEKSQLPITSRDSKRSQTDTNKLTHGERATDFSKPKKLTSMASKDERKEVAMCQKIDQPKQRNVNKKPVKNIPSNPASDVVKNRPKGSINTCSHSHKSACNMKCDKNKKTTILEKTSSKQSRETVLPNDHTNIIRMNCKYQTEALEESNQSNRSALVSSKANDMNAQNSTEIDHKSTDLSTSQSMDLSLNLLVQNFPLSPPSDSKEIRLSIGITSDRNKPELKVNISQREVSPNLSKTTEKSCQVNEKETQVKSCKRLSSHSDSRIPRFKKSSCKRPKSFSGGKLDCKLSVRKPTGNNNHSTTSNHTKIPVINAKSVPVSTTVQDDSLSDSCFKTPGSNFFSSDSITYMDESFNLSAICSPEEENYSKRESIARILKENTGHVKEKVNLYDSKSQSSSSSNVSENRENRKLSRTSSEKCSYREKIDSYTYDSNFSSAKKGGSLRNKSYKFTFTPPPKFLLTDTDTPSPVLKQIKEDIHQKQNNPR